MRTKKLFGYMNNATLYECTVNIDSNRSTININILSYKNIIFI